MLKAATSLFRDTLQYENDWRRIQDFTFTAWFTALFLQQLVSNVKLSSRKKKLTKSDIRGHTFPWKYSRTTWIRLEGLQDLFNTLAFNVSNYEVMPKCFCVKDCSTEDMHNAFWPTQHEQLVMLELHDALKHDVHLSKIIRNCFNDVHYWLGDVDVELVVFRMSKPNWEIQWSNWIKQFFLSVLYCPLLSLSSASRF